MSCDKVAKNCHYIYQREIEKQRVREENFKYEPHELCLSMTFDVFDVITRWEFYKREVFPYSTDESNANTKFDHFAVSLFLLSLPAMRSEHCSYIFLAFFFA